MVGLYMTSNNISANNEQHGKMSKITTAFENKPFVLFVHVECSMR